MPRKTMNIQFPALGVVRRGGLRAATDRRGPYPAAWATNVRLEDSLTNRLRGGSFTAIAAGARPTEIIYRDRLLTFDDNAISASRQGDHTDFDSSKDISDTMRATVFQLSEAGEVGGGEVGERQAEVGQVTLGVDSEDRQPRPERLLDQDHPEACLARPGHADDHPVRRQRVRRHGDVAGQVRGRSLVGCRVDGAAEEQVCHDVRQ